MKDQDNIISFNTTNTEKKSNDILEAIQKRILIQGLNDINPPTPIQRNISHLQGQIGALWLSIPDQGEETDDPQSWEPWMLKSIVQTLKELDQFLVDWYRDENK